MYGVTCYNQTDGVEIIHALNRLKILLSNINSKSCSIKIDEFFNTGDRVHIIGYRTLNKSITSKLRINDDLNEYYSIASFS